MKRTLILRKQPLAELTPAELDVVAGGHTGGYCFVEWAAYTVSTAKIAEVVPRILSADICSVPCA